MGNVQDIIFIWTRKYKEIFKSALVYLYQIHKISFYLFFSLLLFFKFTYFSTSDSACGSICDHFLASLIGHSKNMFAEGRGEGSLKSEQKRTGGGGSWHLPTFVFLKKHAEILKMKFHSYSPVFPIDYNGSMKY